MHRALREIVARGSRSGSSTQVERHLTAFDGASVLSLVRRGGSRCYRSWTRDVVVGDPDAVGRRRAWERTRLPTQGEGRATPPPARPSHHSLCGASRLIPAGSGQVPDMNPAVGGARARGLTAPEWPVVLERGRRHDHRDVLLQEQIRGVVASFFRWLVERTVRASVGGTCNRAMPDGPSWREFLAEHSLSRSPVVGPVNSALVMIFR